MPSTAHARAGLTLIELLLVMGLLALLFGIGLGMFTALDLESRATVASVQNALRTANHWAVVRGAPARVRLEPEAGRLWPEGLVVVGTWHFEGLPLVGAFGLDGGGEDIALTEQGFQGRALSLPERGTHVSVPVEPAQGWDFAEGFAFGLALKPGERPAGRVLAIGGSAGLDLLPRGGLRAWLTAERTDELGARSGTSVVLDTPPGLVPSGRWTRVDVSYDRQTLVLRVEGVPVARLEETAPVWRVDGPFVLGDPRQGYRGEIDMVVVSAVSQGERVELPEGVRLARPAPETISFAPGGGLDRRRHGGPVELALEFPDGRRHPLVVSVYGTVR
jgi:hypothetical protein